MVPKLLTLAADKEVTFWKGFVLVFFLFIANTLWTVTYAAVTTLGTVSGL